MVKVAADPKPAGKQFTVDIEVGGENGTHSYCIKTNTGRIISHNSVSLLAGSTPGVHFPLSRCYIRRVRLMRESPLIEKLQTAGYNVEPCVNSPDSTVVVEIPIKLDDNVRTQSEVSIWEKAELTRLLQRYWSDNQVSVTIDFDREKEGDQIQHILNYYEDELKSVSFLPRMEGSLPYPQMPYEEIDEATYAEKIKSITKLNFDEVEKEESDDIQQEVFCDGDTCFLAAEKATKR